MNNSSKEVLKINKLNAIYPNTTTYVLRELNLNMNRGDRLALVGSSGCGKSTVAKAVMQLLPNGCVCDGEIFLNGKNVLDLDKVSLQTIRGKEVGLIFQDPMSRLNPLMTVGDHLVDTFKAHDNSESTYNLVEKAKNLLEKVGIDPLRFNSFPHEFSGGMRQRVAIALAICLKPSAGLMLIFLKLPSLLSVILGFLVIQLSSYLYLRINPLDGFLHYLSNLSSFSQTYPYPIDVDISNLSFWTLLNNIRHSDLFLLNPIGVFLQGLINNGNLVAVISVVLYFLLIKFLKVDIYDSHIYFAGYIAITVMLREFTGYYAAIYFVIPLVLLFRKHKLDFANLIFGIFVFITMQPIQIFISKNYLMQYENLQTLYRLSSSFNVLIVFLICGSLILFDINKSLKN